MKAPGTGGINPELISCKPLKLLEMFRKLFERCINREDVSEDWRTSYAAPSYKNNSKVEARNYRGIAVIPTIVKNYCRILWMIYKLIILNMVDTHNYGNKWKI